MARADALGEAIKARLSGLIGTHGVSDVRGNGFMLAVELCTSEGNPDGARLERVKLSLRERGLLTLTCGAGLGDPSVDNTALRLIPPLNTPEDILWRGISIVEETIKTV